MERAAQAGDFEYIRRLGHTLKGISRPYGFDHLEGLSQRLEAAGESEVVDHVREVAAEIRAYVENVKVVFDP